MATLITRTGTRSLRAHTISATRQSLPISSTRHFTSTTTKSISVSGQPSDVEASPHAKQTAPLTPEMQKFLESALRVNHAGELAATLIYTAQTPPLIRAYPHLRPLMKHMYDQEAGHFKTFNHLLAKHRIRPTALYPVWQVAATALGWGTAMLGKEAAMACTEAVETEIGDHYNSQVRVLLQWQREMEAKGLDSGDELRELITNIKRIRDEELEHLDHAVEHDAKEAQPYEPLVQVIRGGCRAAIWITEKV
jgi:ubiquinone biosynthesis monooxygenase Coq7